MRNMNERKSLTLKSISYAPTQTKSIFKWSNISTVKRQFTHFMTCDKQLLQKEINWNFGLKFNQKLSVEKGM